MFSDENKPPPSPSYQYVARSRSFQEPGDEGVGGDVDIDNDYDNNFNNLNKGYRTLPNRSSQKKIKSSNRPRKGSETRHCVIDKSNTDYDFPLNNTEKLIHDHFLPPNFRRMARPPVNPLSSIRPEQLTCDLLPPGPKGLDKNIVLNTKAILLNKTPRSISLHLTKIDTNLTFAVDAKELGMGVTSGLELLTLPQGSRLRKDVIERWESLRLFTMLTLLFSPNVTEIAKVLSMWIQACFELKNNAGNLFSFSAIMEALTTKPIHRLKDAWLILRQNHTSSAYLFDTKLRPAFICLKDGSSDLPLNNVSVPFIMPTALLLELQEAPLSGFLNESGDNVKAVWFDSQFWWEAGLDQIGVAMDVLLTHLDTARIVAAECSLYRMTGSAVLKRLVIDRDLEVALSPAFHMLLLWGEKGCTAPRHKRVDKIEEIFSLLSNKHQVPGDMGTEV